MRWRLTKQTLEIITSVVDKSVVVFEEGEKEAGERYCLLETVRQYVLEGLEANGEIKRIKTRPRDWFVAFAETAKLGIVGHWLT